MPVMLGKISAGELHGPLADLLDKLGGSDGDKWLAGFKRFLRKEEPWPRCKYSQINGLSLGTYTSVGALIGALECGNYGVSEAALGMLKRPLFAIAAKKTMADLLVARVEQLGLHCGAGFRAICEKAAEVGLQLCPPEIGPQLLFQHTLAERLPSHQELYIAMAPIPDLLGNPRIFRVSCHPTPGLNESYIHRPIMFGAGDSFVFVPFTK